MRRLQLDHKLVYMVRMDNARRHDHSDWPVTKTTHAM